MQNIPSTDRQTLAALNAAGIQYVCTTDALGVSTVALNRNGTTLHSATGGGPSDALTAALRSCPAHLFIAAANHPRPNSLGGGGS